MWVSYHRRCNRCSKTKTPVIVTVILYGATMKLIIFSLIQQSVHPTLVLSAYITMKRKQSEHVIWESFFSQNDMGIELNLWDTDSIHNKFNIPLN